MNRGPAIAALLLALLPLTACVSLDAGRGPPSGAVQATGASPWREDLGDPVLSDLLRQADLGSLDVMMAVARLRRADAAVDLAKANGSPQLDLSLGGAVGGHTFSQARARAAPALTAGYELDLWGRLARATDAARAERGAAADEVTAARLLVGAATSRAYLALRLAQASLQSAGRRQAEAARALDLMSQRQKEGRALGADVSTRRDARSELEGEVAAAQLEITRRQVELGALLGRTEAISVPGPAGLPDPAPIAELPSEVVNQRPEVEAAFARLTAADARRAEAVAASRPRFVISLALGAADPGVVNLLDARSLIWAAAGELSQSLLDGGANKARIRGARAEADLAALAYCKAVVQAWGEVHTALAAYSAALAEQTRGSGRLAGARQALAAGEARHSAGAADGLDLAALRDQAERGALAAQQAQAKALSARLDLALAAAGQ